MIKIDVVFSALSIGRSTFKIGVKRDVQVASYSMNYKEDMKINVVSNQQSPNLINDSAA